MMFILLFLLSYSLAAAAVIPKPNTSLSTESHRKFIFFNINLLSQRDLLSFGLSFLSLKTTEVSQTSEIWHEKL